MSNKIEIPEILYHGTNAQFEQFDPALKGSNTQYRNTVHGFFFCEKPEHAAMFGKHILVATISMEKPVDLRIHGIFNNKDQASMLCEMAFDVKLSPAWALKKIYNYIGLGEIMEFYELLNSQYAHDVFCSAGYDGIVSDMGDNNNEYIVFNPSQITIRGVLGHDYTAEHERPRGR